jgi:hypothetical protein
MAAKTHDRVHVGIGLSGSPTMSFAIESASAANIAPAVHSTGATARRSGSLACCHRRTSSAAVKSDSASPAAR